VSYRKDLKKGRENFAGGIEGSGGAPGSTRVREHKGKPGQSGEAGLPGQIHYFQEP
jgi:hypothetical protein